MTYNWYNIFNKTEFDEAGFVSQQFDRMLEIRGFKTFLVTQGNFLSVLVDGIYLSLDLGGMNPFPFEDMAIYLEESTQDVWIGYLNED